MTTPFGAIAAALGGYREGQDRRDEKARRKAEAEREAEQDAERREGTALARAAQMFQLDAPKRQQQDRERLAGLVERARAGDAQAVAAVIAERPDLADEFRPKAPGATPTHLPQGSMVPDGKGGWTRAGGEAPEEFAVSDNYTVGGKRQPVRMNKGGTKFTDLQGTPIDSKQIGIYEAPRQSQAYTPTRVDARLDRLQGKFGDEQLVKDANQTASALAPVATSLKLNTPLGDVMSLYAIVKLFDPGSVVKEGEIKLAASANSLPDRVRLLLENAAYGRKLTPAYRPQIEALAKEITEQRRTQVRPIQARYGAQVRGIGGSPSDSAYVAPDPFEGQVKFGGIELIPAPKKKP